MDDSIRGNDKYEWTKEFWDYLFENTRCVPIEMKMPTQKLRHTKISIENLLRMYEQLMDSYLKDLPSTHIEAKHDAFMGTALFAVAVAKEILKDDDDSVLGLFGVRVIAESIINLSYLLTRDDPELWKKFRDYGIGKAKLSNLKVDGREDFPHYLPVDKLKLIANEDRWEEFVAIDVGDWSGENLRDRAVKSDTKDIYDDYYEWPSVFMHGQWGALRYYVFDNCINPMHRFHRMASYPTHLKTVKYDLEILIDRLAALVNKACPGINISLQAEDSDTDASP